MPIVIYQLGDVPLFHTMVGGDGKPVSLDLSPKWRLPSTTLSGVSGSVSYLPLTRSLIETPTVKISGTIRPTAPYATSRTFAALKSLGGRRNIPLIGFLLENPDDAEEPVSDLLWVYRDVTITDIDDKFDYNDDNNVWAFDQQPITISMKGSPRWRALSPWFWEYRDPLEYIINPADESNAQVGVDNYFRHPARLDDLQLCYYFYRWQSELSRYNPTFWGMKYSGGLLGGSGSDFTDFGTFEFYSDPILWSAEPSSVYAFTGLSPAGSISITVQRPTGLFSGEVKEEISTLDLEQLDADLDTAGYGGLRIDDIIFTGNLSPFPGFVYRDDERILDFRPKWSYPGTYPGETGRGYNTFTVSSVDTTGQVAFLHDYGMV